MNTLYANDLKSKLWNRSLIHDNYEFKKTFRLIEILTLKYVHSEKCYRIYIFAPLSSWVLCWYSLQIPATEVCNLSDQFFECEGESLGPTWLCSQDELDSNLRLKMLRLRDSKVPEFQGLQRIPALASQILRATVWVS